MKTPSKRFNEKIEYEPNTGCWLWTACVTKTGYGQIWINRKNWYAHRFSFFLHNGELPVKPYCLDHICRERSCVNPEHLRILTHRENILLGIGACAKHAKQTHCKYGHEFTLENTYSWKKEYRQCRICMKRRQKERWQKKQNMRRS